MQRITINTSNRLSYDADAKAEERIRYALPNMKTIVKFAVDVGGIVIIAVNDQPTMKLITNILIEEKVVPANTIVQVLGTKKMKNDLRERYIQRAAKGEITIIVGTSIICVGASLPNVTGVIQVGSLYTGNNVEHLCGRGHREGEVTKKTRTGVFLWVGSNSDMKSDYNQCPNSNIPLLQYATLMFQIRLARAMFYSATCSAQILDSQNAFITETSPPLSSCGLCPSCINGITRVNVTADTRLLMFVILQTRGLLNAIGLMQLVTGSAGQIVKGSVDDFTLIFGDKYPNDNSAFKVLRHATESQTYILIQKLIVEGVLCNTDLVLDLFESRPRRSGLSITELGQQLFENHEQIEVSAINKTPGLPPPPSDADGMIPSYFSVDVDACLISPDLSGVDISLLAVNGYDHMVAAAAAAAAALKATSSSPPCMEPQHDPSLTTLQADLTAVLPSQLKPKTKNNNKKSSHFDFDDRLHRTCKALCKECAEMEKKKGAYILSDTTSLLAPKKVVASQFVSAENSCLSVFTNVASTSMTSAFSASMLTAMTGLPFFEGNVRYAGLEESFDVVIPVDVLQSIIFLENDKFKMKDGWAIFLFGFISNSANSIEIVYSSNGPYIPGKMSHSGLYESLLNSEMPSGGGKFGLKLKCSYSDCSVKILLSLEEVIEDDDGKKAFRFSRKIQTPVDKKHQHSLSGCYCRGKWNHDPFDTSSYFTAQNTMRSDPDNAYKKADFCFLRENYPEKIPPSQQLYLNPPNVSVLAPTSSHGQVDATYICNRCALELFFNHDFIYIYVSYLYVQSSVAPRGQGKPTQELYLNEAAKAKESRGATLQTDASQLTMGQAKLNRTRQLAAIEINVSWLSELHQLTDNYILRGEAFLDWYDKNNEPVEASTKVLLDKLGMHYGFAQSIYKYGCDGHEYTIVLHYNIHSLIFFLRDGHGKSSLVKTDSTMYGEIPKVCGCKIIETKTKLGLCCTAVLLKIHNSGGVDERLDSKSVPSLAEFEATVYAEKSGLPAQVLVEIYTQFFGRMNAMRKQIGDSAIVMEGVPATISPAMVQCDHGAAEGSAINTAPCFKYSKIKYDYYHSMTIIKVTSQILLDSGFFTATDASGFQRSLLSYLDANTKAIAKQKADTIRDNFQELHQAWLNEGKNKGTADNTQSRFQNSIEACIFKDPFATCLFGRKDMARRQGDGSEIESINSRNKYLFNTDRTQSPDVLMYEMNRNRESDVHRLARGLHQTKVDQENTSRLMLDMCMNLKKKDRKLSKGNAVSLFAKGGRYKKSAPQALRQHMLQVIYIYFNM
jgi:hypothetical protein